MLIKLPRFINVVFIPIKIVKKTFLDKFIVHGCTRKRNRNAYFQDVCPQIFSQINSFGHRFLCVLKEPNHKKSKNLNPGLSGHRFRFRRQRWCAAAPVPNRSADEAWKTRVAPTLSGAGPRGLVSRRRYRGRPALHSGLCDCANTR